MQFNIFPWVWDEGLVVLRQDNLLNCLSFLGCTHHQGWHPFRPGCEQYTKKLTNSFKWHKMIKLKLALLRLWISLALTQGPELWVCALCGYKTSIKSLPLWLFVTQNSEDLGPELAFFPWHGSFSKKNGEGLGNVPEYIILPLLTSFLLLSLETRTLSFLTRTELPPSLPHSEARNTQRCSLWRQAHEEVGAGNACFS